MYREPQSGMIPRGWREADCCLECPLARLLASRAAAAAAAAAAARVAMCATRCHTNSGLEVSFLRPALASPPAIFSYFFQCVALCGVRFRLWVGVVAGRSHFALHCVLIHAKASPFLRLLLEGFCLPRSSAWTMCVVPYVNPGRAFRLLLDFE